MYWKKRNVWAIGGLLEIGFYTNSDLLMVLSSQGRGLFDCLKDEKISRDNNDVYYEICQGNTGKVKGIGVLENELIDCGGFEFPDVLRKSTNDHWRVQIRNEKRPNWKKEEMPAEVMYLTNDIISEELEVGIFHYKIDRAYGFSNTGKSFVNSTSSEVSIWNRIMN